MLKEVTSLLEGGTVIPNERSEIRELGTRFRNWSSSCSAAENWVSAGTSCGE